jgi:F-box/WD-40 domain protein 7
LPFLTFAVLWYCWIHSAAPSAAGGSTELPEKAVERSGSDAKGLKAPSSFFCPISMDLMADPVMVATGHTYDRSCIERWLAQGHRTCPATGVRLRHLELTPNFALRSAIQVRPVCTPHFVIETNQSIFFGIT